MLLCAILVLLLNCSGAFFASFRPLFVTQRSGIGPAALSALPFVKSAVTLLVYLLISPRVSLARASAGHF